MKASTKKLLNFAFIFLTLGIVIYIGLKGNDIKDIGAALSSLTPFYLVLCMLAWLGYLAFDALSMFLFLRKAGYPIPFGSAYYTSVIGQYYSNITPGASGGQPMQVYSLSKKNVPIGIGTSAITVKFSAQQSMLVLAGGVLWLIFRDFVNTQADGYMFFLRLGFFINAMAVVLVLLLAINKTLVRTICTGLIKLLTKLHLIKHPDRVQAKAEDTLASFHASVYMLRHEKAHLLIQCLVALCQMTCLMLVVVFVYHAFGLSGCNDFKLITLGFILFLSVSYTPLPGASGMQEGGFAIYFANIFPESRLFMALLLWRFFTYYISLIMGACVTTWSSVDKLFSRRKKAAEEQPAPKPDSNSEA